MAVALKSQRIHSIKKLNINTNVFVQDVIKQTWKKIAPFWSLNNLIAVNPLQGFEELSIEEALIEGAAYFQQPDLPGPMHDINRETMKWLQAFFDHGQATLYMPMRKSGLYIAWRQVAQFDKALHKKDSVKQKWLAQLPECPEKAISEMLLYLKIPIHDWERFLILMLTTLPGWAAHIKYLTDWSAPNNSYSHTVSQTEYLAIRLATTCLLWPEAQILLQWHQNAKITAVRENKTLIDIKNIKNLEHPYQKFLLENIAKQFPREKAPPSAQFVFCIDVRSEPFRRALESTGHYETYGFAGFFGIPVRIKDPLTNESYASCPVLLSPKHTVCKTIPFLNKTESEKDHHRYNLLKNIKQFYQSLKYNFTTPFALAETLGLSTGLWMAVRTFFPQTASYLKTAASSKIRPLPPLRANYSIRDIHFSDQCTYAESALRLMGLTKNFASIVVFCGHGSATQNNAYATALDCGACGGRHGSANACILTEILNDNKVRKFLSKKGLVIPESTYFIGATHNTTTDEVILNCSENLEGLCQIKKDLKISKAINSQWRCKDMGVKQNIASAQHTDSRSKDWAQVRPEWGLARNAAFIVGPRYLTQNMNLEGRAFLHSYDYKQDPDGTSLKTILTAPMVVAQWINSQYLFSTLDNVAYGSGSKITHNITGKLGIMQGNASDLMNGLPLQSVYSTDCQSYHQPQRLITIIYAKRDLIDSLILNEAVLIKLFRNGWVTLACIEPETREYYLLGRDLKWQKTD